MLRLLRPRLSPSVLRAGAPLQLLLPVPDGSRSLRTARGGTRRHKDHMKRIAKLEALAQERERASQEQRQRVLEARNQPPAIPAFIRVRDLAKALRQPLDKVLKHTVTKANRRFRLKTKSHPPAEFRNVKHIVLPFRVAQEVAENFGVQVAYDDVEPELLDATAGLPEELLGCRQPVIAVMGHVDHGKTTLMDTMRKQTKVRLKQIAPYEKHGITQKINVCEAELTPDVKVTFLDTPGHFHFFRMRSSAAQVADAVLLIVAADEGVLLQTEESIGAIEEAGLPSVICVNKVDLLGEDGDEQVNKVVDELHSFVALQDSPVVTISGKTGAGLDNLRHTVWELVTGLADDHRLDALVGAETHAEGLVLESVALKGRGTVLRVLIKNGELIPKQHFVAGMIHGVVRNMCDAEGRDVKRAQPGTVVDITYSNKSKNVDAPNEHGFFVLPEARAKQVIEQRELALEFNDCLLPDEGADAVYTSPEDEGDNNVPNAEVIRDVVDEEDDDVIDEDDLIETKSIIVKADGAGSLTSIQDTVDEMSGISTVRLGIGNISAKDVDVAINGKCPIFGFNVKLRNREAKLATERGVHVILRSTVHELIEEITAFEQADSDETDISNRSESGLTMMAFGDDPEDGMSERLLGENECTRSSTSTAPLTDDFELISERETLVFEDDFFRHQQRLDKRGGFFQTYLMEKIQPGSVKGSMFTMTVAIVGAGVLALPYAVQQAGLVLGIFLIVLGAIATNFTLRLLLECSDLGQARSYMDLASATGGRKLAGFTQSVVCMNLYGTSIGYLVGSAELIQLALRTFLGSTSQSIFLDRQALILMLTGLLVLPLSLLRSLESLRFSSLFSIVCIVFMALVIVIKYFQFVHEGLAPPIAYQFKHLPLFNWRLSHLLRAVPLVVFSYTCHPNVLPIYLVLKRRSSRRMYKVMNRSIGLATTVYSLCGFFVVLTFGEATRSNFLKNNYHGDGAVVAGCLGFSIALILTVPLFVHTLRDNIREALLANRRLDLMHHIGLSVFLVLAALLVALGSGDIASVLGVLGATTNPTICFMLPAFFIFRLGGQHHRASQVIAGLMAVVMTVVSGLSLLQQMHIIA